MPEGITLAPGTVLAGRYRLERLLGAGGMATVWLAQDGQLERPVAVKALSETLLIEGSYVARFEREARVAAGLQHPHLVKVFDYGSERGRPYLVMEYVEGPTLSALLGDREAAIDGPRLAQELLGAIAHIHDAGVVHRDVKPSNVLIGPDGGAKLTDFGIARPTDATELTQTGQVIGTLTYMAPEVREGGRADARSDLYSLGVVLGGCSRGGAAPALAGLIERLTATRPEDRPRSAAEALAELQAGAVEESTAPTLPLAAGAGGGVVGAGGAGAAEAGAAEVAVARRGPGRRELLGLLLAAAAGLGLLLLVSSGGGGEGAGSGSGDRAGAQAQRDRSETPSEPPPPAAEPPVAAVASGCAGLEARKKELERQREAGKEAAQGDKEAEKAVEELFKQREEELKEQEKRCEKGDEDGEGDEEGEDD